MEPQVKPLDFEIFKPNKGNLVMFSVKMITYKVTGQNYDSLANF